MNRQNTFFSLCLYLAVTTTVTSRIITQHYPSRSEEQTGSTSQSEVKEKWESSFTPKQMSDLEKIVKQSLENLFKNEESTTESTSLRLKPLTFKEPELSISNYSNIPEDKEQEVDFSSPHILKVPVPQPYPVHIPVRHPFTVPIFKLVPEEVEKKVPVPVEKIVPIYKEKPVKVIVEKHHPYTVYKPYAVPVPINTHVLIDNEKIPKWVNPQTLVGNEKTTSIKWH